MFAKFKMQLLRNELPYCYEIAGDVQKNHTLFQLGQDLDKYLLPDGSIDGSQLEEVWFPNIAAKVFISHSHADEQIALRLAGFLWERFEISSFIDSTVWGHSNDLLRQLDNKCCMKRANSRGKKVYSYEKRNQSTANIHLLLQGALAKMIDNCECMIFINSRNSIKSALVNDVSQTASPWIYNELLMANLLRKRKLEEHRTDELMHGLNYQLSYPAPLDSFVDIKPDDFIVAAKQVNICTPSTILDQLYRNKGIIRD